MDPQSDPDIKALKELAALNGLLEHRVRLAICVLLSAHDALTFTRLKHALEETDGSLGAHLRKAGGRRIRLGGEGVSESEARDVVSPDGIRSIALEAADRRADAAD